jgi:hypothetical protein
MYPRRLRCALRPTFLAQIQSRQIMASGTLPPPSPPRTRGKRPAEIPHADRFIDEQISKTRAYVKGVDIARSVVTLVTGLLCFFLVAALVDQWIVPGGLGYWGRGLAFLLLAGGAIWHVSRTIAPLLLRKINPLYAAQAIEQVQPSFKNSLLSILQLRQNRAVVPDAVFASVERHAAQRLAEVPVETTVDRTPLLRTSYAMVAIVIVAALYYMLSPKDALRSVGRVLLPWSDIAAPTRVAINDVRPGDTTVVRGQMVEVSAEITGTRSDEPVSIVYSTVDGQTVDRVVPLELPEGAYRHMAPLPPGNERLQQDVVYHLEAGDARTADYHITVEPTPMIEVASVDYDYPAYTEPVLSDTHVVDVADIRALEGTKVTITARANQPIARAAIDFDCDGKLDDSMIVSGDRAKLTFTLGFKNNETFEPLHSSYQIRFYNRSGRDNPNPVQHVITVQRDLAPEVALVQPSEANIEVAEDATVDFHATARDADFKLSEVALRYEGAAGKKPPQSVPLLKSEMAPWLGQFEGRVQKTPRELGFRAGDVIRYWIEAVDNKTPVEAANHATTRPQTIRVLAPKNPDTPADQGKNEKPPQDPQQNPDKNSTPEGANNPGPADKPQPDKPQPDKPQPDEKHPENKPDDRPQDKPQQGADKNDGAGGKSDKPNDAGKGGQPQPAEKDMGGGPSDKDKPKKNDGQGQQPDGTGQGKQPDKPNDMGGQAGQPNDAQNGGAGAKNNDAAKNEGAKPSKNQGGGMGSAAGENDNTSEQHSPSGGKNDGAANPAGGNNTGGNPSKGGKPEKNAGKPDARENGPANDAEAFEQLVKDAQKDGKQPKGGQPVSQTKPDEGGGTAEQPAKPDAGKPNAGSKTDRPGKAPSDDNTANPQSPDGADGPAPKKPGDPGVKPTEAPMDKGERPSDDNGKAAGTPKDQGKPGQGLGKQSQPGASDKKGEPGAAKPEGVKETPDKPKAGEKENSGGLGDQSSGKIGKQGKDESGASQSQATNRPTKEEGNQKDPGGKENHEGKQSSPGISETQPKNPKPGEHKGDRPGGGGPGGGTSAEQPGKDSAGTQTASDEGANAAKEQGKGATGNQGGDGETAKGKTGQSGDQRGDGTKSDKVKDAAKPDKQTDGKPGNGNAPPGAKPEKSDDVNSGSAGGDSGKGTIKPGAGSGAGDGKLDDDPGPRAPAKEDPADLEYAKNATDLALDHLRDRMKSGDDEDLLKKLGWTRDDAKRFLENWDKIKRDAATGKNPNAEKQLHDDLKSLGLRHSTAKVSSGQQTKDADRSLSSAAEVPTPAEFRDRQRAYRVGTSGNGKEQPASASQGGR